MNGISPCVGYLNNSPVCVFIQTFSCISNLTDYMNKFSCMHIYMKALPQRPHRNGLTLMSTVIYYMNDISPCVGYLDYLNQIDYMIDKPPV